MKNKFIFFLFSILITLSSSQVFADPPMISANSFSCIKAQQLVTCEGQFPEVSGTISASGSYGVQIIFETAGPNKVRNIYDSTTGCLMRISINPFGVPSQAFVKNVSGATQTFMLPAQQMPAYQFCKM